MKSINYNQLFDLPFGPSIVAIAIDHCGSIWTYRAKPTQGVASWMDGLPELQLNDKFVITDIPCWKESLLLRPTKWQRPDLLTPVDTPVWYRRYSCTAWVRGHYDGKGGVWSGQNTSWTTRLSVDSGLTIIVAQGELTPSIDAIVED